MIHILSHVFIGPETNSIVYVFLYHVQQKHIKKHIVLLFSSSEKDLLYPEKDLLLFSSFVISCWFVIISPVHDCS